jgi:hypothetical protein
VSKRGSAGKKSQPFNNLIIVTPSYCIIFARSEQPTLKAGVGDDYSKAQISGGSEVVPFCQDGLWKSSMYTHTHTHTHTKLPIPNS